MQATAAVFLMAQPPEQVIHNISDASTMIHHLSFMVVQQCWNWMLKSTQRTILGAPGIDGRGPILTIQLVLGYAAPSSGYGAYSARSGEGVSGRFVRWRWFRWLVKFLQTNKEARKETHAKKRRWFRWLISIRQAHKEKLTNKQTNKEWEGVFECFGGI